MTQGSDASEARTLGSESSTLPLRSLYTTLIIGPLCILRGQRLYFQNNIKFLSLKIDLILANSADPDEMPPDAAFHLGFHWLPKYPFGDFWSSKG